MLIIDGKRIVPAPFVTLSKSYNKTGDDRKLLPIFTINLAGTILPGRGSPNSSGVFHTGSSDPTDESLTTTDAKFNSILRKQDALRELFINPGILLEYGAGDGSPAVLARVKLETINFEPGPWVDLCNYSIELRAEQVNKQSSAVEDDLGGFDDRYLTQASDSITVSQSADGSSTYSVTHSISAVGTTSYDNISTPANSQDAWENARDWVLAQVSSDIVTHLIDTTTQTRYNKVSQETIDRLAGSYSLSITYTIQEDNNDYSHVYNIQKSTTRSQTDELTTGQVVVDTITINGTVTGFDADNDPAVKLTAARTAFNSTILLSLPTLASLNSDHLFTTKNVGEDLGNGTITYSVSYTNNPNGETYLHSYNVSVSYSSGSPSTATVSGTVQGVLIDGDITGVFSTLQSSWATIKTNLRSYAAVLADYSLVNSPSSLQVGFDRQNLRITYTASYNFTDATNTSSANYLDQYEVSISDNNTTMAGVLRKTATASISGSIVGYSASGSSDERYAIAVARWNAIKDSLNERIESVTGGTVPDRVLSRTYAHNRIGGAINYSYTFSIRTDISDAEIIAETVNVEFADPRDVFAVQIIPGLATGPIMQNMGTVTEASTSISASFILADGAVTGVADTRFTEIEALYIPAAPRFISSKSRSYDPQTGVYTIAKTWTHKG